MTTDVAANIKDVNIPTFTTRSQHTANAITVRLSGNADLAAYDQLKAFLDELHERAAALHIKEAIFDLEELFFMNSSCLSLFLRLINAINESRGTHPYTLRFRSNRQLRWQARSLEAISSFAKDIVVLE